MARWALCWLVVIIVATLATYAGTNALVGSRAFDHAEYAMLPLGELGSPTCRQASRAMIAAGDGTSANASAEERQAYDHAAAAVLAACGAA